MLNSAAAKGKLRLFSHHCRKQNGDWNLISSYCCWWCAAPHDLARGYLGAVCQYPISFISLPYSFSLKVIIENLQIPAGVVKDMVNAHLPQPKIDILMLWYPAYPSWRPGKHSFKSYTLIYRFNFVSSWLKGYSRAKLGNPACGFKVFGLNSNTSKKRKFPVQCSMCVSVDISTL